MFSRNQFFILIVIVAAVSIARFMFLEKSPPGFYVDESIGATNVICVRQTGSDGYGVSMPLFADAAKNAGGYTTPTYLYLGVVWTSIFGDSIFSFRAFVAFLTSLTILGLFFLVRSQIGHDAAWITVLVASLSPWAWQFSRISWDPPLMPLFVVWGAYFFLSANRYRNAVLAGIFLALAMYSYPPARIMVPALIVGLVYYKYFIKKLDSKAVFIFVMSLVLSSLPLISFLMTPESLARFGIVGIANENYLRQFGEPNVFTFLRIFIKNFFIHFSPKYLFFTGDSNLRHATQLVGQMSWLDGFGILAILVLKFKKQAVTEKKFLYLCLFGFVCGILPAALTWESIPHALRSIGSWPFLAIVAGIGLTELIRKNKNAIYSILIVAVLFGLLFGYKYFAQYPKMAYPWFDTDVKNLAIEAKQSADWLNFDRQTENYLELGRKYFHMVYGGQKCH